MLETYKIPGPAHWIIAVVHVLSICKVVIGMMTVIRYLSVGESQVGLFGKDPPMALETSIAVMSGGLCLFLLATLVHHHLRHCHLQKEDRQIQS